MVNIIEVLIVSLISLGYYFIYERYRRNKDNCLSTDFDAAIGQGPSSLFLLV